MSRTGIRSTLVDRRHIVAALAIGLMVEIVSLGAVGFAVAGDPAAQDGTPDPFGLPAPRVGDRGTYVLSVVPGDSGASDLRAEERAVLEFEVLPPRVMRDRAGQQRLAFTVHHRLIEDDGAPGGDDTRAYERESHRDPFAGRDFAYTSIHRSSRDFDRGETGQTTWRTTGFMHLGTSYADEHNAPCGLWNALQGRQVGLGTPVSLFTGCYVVSADLRSGELIVRDRSISHGAGSWGGGYVGDDVAFRAVASAGDGNDRVVRFAWAEEAPSADRRDAIDVWFHRDKPYPVQIVTTPYGSDEDAHVVLRLDRLERSTGPRLLPDDPPKPDPLPPVELGPRDILGPSAEEVDHPFPLREAFERARDNPDDDTLQAFLSDRPDAYVAEARVSEHYDDMTVPSHARSWQWGFVVTNGKDALDVTVWRHRDEARGALEELAGIGTPRLASDYDIEYERLTDDDRLESLPPADLLPGEVPTVASVMERWRAYRTQSYRETAANSWGFRTQCSLRDGVCEGASFTVDAGWYVARFRGTAVLPETHEWNASLLAVAADGTTESLQEVVQRHTYAWADLGPSGDAEDDRRAATAGGAVPAELWRFPTEHAAAIGLVAALTALLYWAWPALKTLPLFPLHTRLGRDDLLDHPVRAEILDALRDRPGIHRAALADELGLSEGTVRHHLGKLRQGGLVTASDAHGFVCYFPRGEVDLSMRRALPALTSRGARRVLHAVMEAPGRSNKELAEATGLSPSTVHHHVQRLCEAGLVEARREGRRVALSPTEVAERALQVRTA